MSTAARLLAVLCLAALPPAAVAQSLKWSGDATPPAEPVTPPAQTAPPQRTGDYLGLMDTDRDRRVSPQEYQDWLSYAFDGMDRNRDGVLTPDEQPGGRGKTVTRDEHRLRIAERFRRQDRDRNGFLDAQELSSPPQ
jgi:hypothetical protein